MAQEQDDTLAASIDRAFREIRAIDDAYARGELDDARWHRAMAAIIVPAYTQAATVQGGSGHGGTAEEWEWSRGVVAEALDRNGTFLDVGCANGLLMESVERWAQEAGFDVIAHGLDIAPELADLAVRRVPAFRGRVHVGNVLGFRPVERFDLVRTGLEYVPRSRRRELVAWLLDEVIAEGGRLIIGKHNERVELRAVERELERWGFLVTGRGEREHRKEPRLAYRACWIDAPRATDGDLRLRALREVDLPQLSDWLAAPHVARWWNLASGLEEVRTTYLPRIAGDEPTYMVIAEERGRPIGWLQWYRWRDYPEHAARIGASSTDVGIDLAIGEPDRLGRGLGPRIIRLLLEGTVFVDPTITACLCDPHRDNARSLRAFEKAGFAILADVGRHGESRVVRRRRD